MVKTAGPVDSIKLKSAAPDRDRAERILTVSSTPAPEKDENEAVEEAPVEESHEGEVGRSPSEESDQIEEVAWTDLDEAWNGELKDFLSRVEPAESETIHKTYLGEVEGYKAEMEALLNERQQKTTDEAISEVDQLISELDQKHEDKLKDIFGAHYEAVRDHYNQYMEANSDSEE